jgi:S-adenosylmethionine:tRNA ribosyltransferase-isomerase
MRTDELDFHLPPELIAQNPMPDRAASRLMHYCATDQSISHRRFSDLPALLRAGDLLVLNDARVIPARFTLRKSSGGRVEGLFLGEVRTGRWHVLLRNLGHRAGGALRFAAAPQILATPVRFGPAGEYEIDVHSDEPAVALLLRIGRMPLPPYIRRGKDADPRDEFDRERYQTIFARAPGSVAAPTAGLHFTEQILAESAARGVERAFVTLHVGMGTFKPVAAETLKGHAMHAEAYSISAEAADALNRAKRERRRIIAVGTTAARVLESQSDCEPFAPRADKTRIFIYPPYRWKHVGALVTNFHLPRSTLIALVAARLGLDEQRRLYQVGIEHRYRFFSYGDAMFLE